MKQQDVSLLGRMIMSPLIVLVPILIIFLLGGLSLGSHSRWQLSNVLDTPQATLFHLGVTLFFSTAYCVFLFAIRRYVTSLILARDGSQFEATEKTKVLREEIRQHKAARSELQRLATHDQLTGTRNRRHFIDTLNSELERFKRYRSDFSIMIIALDNFQKINDAHGHECGDFVLQRFAESVEKKLRQSDTFVRYSGQEFAIIATNTHLDSAKRFGDKLCQEVEALNIRYQEKSINITLSIGVGSPKLISDLTTQSLISITEKALAVAKKKGRNKTIAALSQLTKTND